MRSNTSKLLGAVAVAGLVAATGSAFTGTGLSTSGTASAAQFVGGTVTQSVTGATLSEIRYTFSNAPANTLASSATLTFDAAANGKPVSVLINGTTPVDCGTVAETAVSSGVYTATCTLANVSVDSIDVTVNGTTVV